MQLRTKHWALITDLASGQVGRNGAIEKYGIRPTTLDKWFADPVFSKALENRVRALTFDAQRTVTAFASLAATNLVELCGSEAHESARKACLDVMRMAAEYAAAGLAGKVPAQAESPPDNQGPIDQETASEVLDLLARKAKGALPGSARAESDGWSRHDE